jgi:glycosyltransferase involved in cell wall biosynthesis
MAEQPLVCICIPTFNAAKTIRQTLLSVLSQTYKNIIVHISDNCSTDGTIDVIRSVADSRVCVHQQISNVGAEDNFDNCIKLAEGKYTAIFHADDFYEPKMIEKQVSFLEDHPGAGAVFTEASIIDQEGLKFGEIKFPFSFDSSKELCTFEKIFKAVLRHSNFLICPSVMVRTKIYQEDIQFWRGNLFKSSSDLDVWFRIALKYQIGLIYEPLMRYRISSSQYSEKTRSQTERADFFLVMDHYLMRDDVRHILNSSDLENYARLDRRDKVMRALNFLINKNFSEAKNILDEVSLSDLFKAGIQSNRDIGVMIGLIYLQTLIFFRFEKLSQVTLSYLKRVMRK